MIVIMQAGGFSWPAASMAILVIALLLSAYVLWRRYQSRQLLLKRIAELEELSDAGRTLLAGHHTVQSLCEVVGREVEKILGSGAMQIGLFEDNLYHVHYWMVDGQPRQAATLNLEEESSLAGWIRQSGQTLLIRDLRKEVDQLPAQPRYMFSNAPRSAIFIPLISSNNNASPETADLPASQPSVIGVLSAQSAQPNRFSEEDLRRLTILANQAAAAIVNTRLFEQERQRAAHLELVVQIARQVNAIQETDELFTQVVHLTRETFGFDPVNIFGIDPQTGDAVIQASSIKELSPGAIRLAPNQGLVGVALANRQTTVANDTLADERFIAKLDLPDLDVPQLATRAEIIIPLIVNDELLGVLDVHSSQPGVFNQQEQTVLEALAAQIAVAIHKARQFARQREQAWITTAQLQVAEAVNESHDLDDLVNAITRLIPLLTGVAQCSLLLWNNEMEIYQGAALYGAAAPAGDRFRKIELAIGDWPPLDAVHVGLTYLTTRQRPPWLPADGPSYATTIYPLVAKGQIMGMMLVSRESPGQEEAAGQPEEALHERQDELLNRLADQVAQAIESAQLSIAQQEEAWVNTALLQVAEAVNSLIDLHEILDTIVRLVPMLVGVKSCFILIWDETERHFRIGPSHGLNDMERGLIESFEIETSDFPVAEGQDSDRLNRENAYYILQLPAWLERIMHAPNAYAFPLNARSRLVGIMVVGPPAAGRLLSGRRLNILTGIAQQAAIAVVNDQLYQESAERERMEQELDVARQIQASLMPDGNPDLPGCTVASYWQAARQVSGDFYDFLALPNGRWGVVVADVADKGVPAALFMALSRTILRAVAFNRQDPSPTLQRANDIILQDSQSDLFVTVFYAVWDGEQRTLTYANAGHNPPILMHGNGQSKLLTCEGIALGVLENITIKQDTVELSPGDLVVFYTDGVTEAMNEDYDEFGMERLRLAIHETRHEDAAAVAAAITRAVQDHAGDTPQFDDITLVVMKYLG